MLQTFDKTIDGHDYQVTQFAAMRGLKHAVKISKIVGPGSVKALKGITLSDALNADASLVDLVEALISNLDEEETPKFILDMFASTHRDRKQLDEKGFNVAYAANYNELFKALMFVLEVNYGSFFGALQLGDTGSLQREKPTEKSQFQEN